MAREIQLLLDNSLSTFAFKKISRDDLYGYKKRIALDHKNQPCTRIQIDEDTGNIIPSGGLEGVYIDPQFNFIEKDALDVQDANFQTLKKLESTLGAPQILTPISAEEVLNLEVGSLYLLTPSELDAKLDGRLTDGEFFQFSFNYYADYNLETGVLLKSADNLFCLIGNICPSDWVQANTRPTILEDVIDEEELDFQMF